MVSRQGLVLLGVVAVVLGSGETAVAQGVPAETTMLRLHVADLPAVGLTGFTGALGQVGATPPQQTSTWNGSDPAGVLAHVNGWHGGPAGPGAAAASVNDSISARDASTSWAGIGLRLSTGPNLVSIGSLHTYARCTTAPLSDSQQAYAASAANTLYLFDDLGRPLTEGTQTVPATGAALGLAAVGTASLTITVRHVRETGPLWAHAKVEATADAALNGKGGGQL